MEDQAVRRFKSHIDGKNADVIVYADRIEWAREARTGLSTGKKLALGMATGGVSLLATGVSGKQRSSEVMPVKAMTSVVTKRDGLRFTAVVVTAAGNNVSFRVGHDEAQDIKTVLTQLMMGSHPSQSPFPTPRQTDVPQTAPGAAIADELRKLKQLQEDGILSQDEFDVEKLKLLGR